MFFFFFFFKQKTAYEMCGRDWSSDVCSSDLKAAGEREDLQAGSLNAIFLLRRRLKRLRITKHNIVYVSSEPATNQYTLQLIGRHAYRAGRLTSL